jgi:predicted nucleic acid-binding protein
MSEPSESPTVLDATVLSNYAYIERVNLLEKLPDVCTTPGVRDEIEEGTQTYPYLQAALDSMAGKRGVSIANLTEKEEDVAEGYLRSLDPGESEALAVATQRDGTLVTDDAKARSVAREDGVTVTGSIGILVAGVEAGKIDERDADGWLKQWIDETGYRAPSRNIQDFL